MEWLETICFISGDIGLRRWIDQLWGALHIYFLRPLDLGYTHHCNNCRRFIIDLVSSSLEGLLRKVEGKKKNEE